MRKLLTVICSLVVIGCAEPKQSKREGKTEPEVVNSSLEQIAFEAFQKRDRLRAKYLLEAKGKGTKYDIKRQEVIAEIGARASEESWAPVAAELSRRLDRVSQSDQAAFDQVLNELAKAAERAGK